MIFLESKCGHVPLLPQTLEWLLLHLLMSVFGCSLSSLDFPVTAHALIPPHLPPALSGHEDWVLIWASSVLLFLH